MKFSLVPTVDLSLSIYLTPGIVTLHFLHSSHDSSGPSLAKSCFQLWAKKPCINYLWMLIRCPPKRNDLRQNNIYYLTHFLRGKTARRSCHGGFFWLWVSPWDCIKIWPWLQSLERAGGSISQMAHLHSFWLKLLVPFHLDFSMELLTSLGIMAASFHQSEQATGEVQCLFQPNLEAVHQHFRHIIMVKTEKS